MDGLPPDVTTTFTDQAGLICGRMRKIVWNNLGDIVLVSIRELQPDTADVIHKYTANEARNLQAFGELPASARRKITGEDSVFDFDEVDEIEV